MANPSLPNAVRAVLSIVAEQTGMTLTELRSGRRHKGAVRARQIAILILRERASFSYPEIGLYLGGRDHSTVIHSHRRGLARLETDLLFRRDAVSTLAEVIATPACDMAVDAFALRRWAVELLRRARIAQGLAVAPEPPRPDDQAIDWYAIRDEQIPDLTHEARLIEPPEGEANDALF